MTHRADMGFRFVRLVAAAMLLSSCADFGQNIYDSDEDESQVFRAEFSDTTPAQYSVVFTAEGEADGSASFAVIVDAIEFAIGESAVFALTCDQSPDGELGEFTTMADTTDRNAVDEVLSLGGQRSPNLHMVCDLAVVPNDDPVGIAWVDWHAATKYSWDGDGHVDVGVEVHAIAP